MNELNEDKEWYFKVDNKSYEIDIIQFENIKICEYDRLSNLKRHYMN